MPKFVAKDLASICTIDHTAATGAFQISMVNKNIRDKPQTCDSLFIFICSVHRANFSCT